MLSFFTNEELIQELLSRKTFAGIIVRPDLPIEEISGDTVNFSVFWNLNDCDVETILKNAIKKIKEIKDEQ